MHGRTLTYPFRFKCLGNQGDMLIGTARSSVSIKETVGSEIRTGVLDDVKCEGVTY